MKRQFRILLIAPEYKLNIQAQIPSALCVIHNFIRRHDLEEGELHFSDDLDSDYDEEFQPAVFDEEDTTNAGHFRDQIAKQMWDDYIYILNERGIESLDGSDEDFTDSNNE